MPIDPEHVLTLTAYLRDVLQVKANADAVPSEALAEMQLQDAKLEEFDVEVILEFANRILSDLSRFWLQATLDQKIGLQKVLFPEGLKFDGERFGTAPTCLAFNYLQGISSGESSLASRTGVEPVSPP